MHVGGARRRIGLDDGSRVGPYVRGNLVGIESKHLGSAHRIFDGEGLTFEDIEWTRVRARHLARM